MVADYEHLNPREQGFLKLERAGAPLHMLRVQLFSAAGLSNDSGGAAVDRVRERVGARLGDLRRYRRVVAELPLESRAIWVDAEELDLELHVRHVRLPRPGGERQLKRLVGRIAATLLDPARPLWELWVIEGIEGARIALVTKVHACLEDRQARGGLADALLTEVPSDKVGPPAHWRPRPRPGPIELAIDELRELTHLPGDWWDRVRHWVAPEDSELALGERVRAMGQAVATGLHGGSESPFDGEVGSLRRTDWTCLAAEDLDVMVRRFDATIEEIALTIATGALANFLQETRGISLEGMDLRALIPLDPGAEAARRGELAWIVELPFEEADPIRCLEEIRRRSRSQQAHEQAQGAGLLAALGAQVPGAIVSLATRILQRRHPFSLVIATEHARSDPSFLLGSRLEQTMLLEPVTHGLALSISLVHGSHGLSWGFNADWDRFPDLHELVQATDNASTQLLQAAR